jgi:hypothetical protein
MKLKFKDKKFGAEGLQLIELVNRVIDSLPEQAHSAAGVLLVCFSCAEFPEHASEL